VRVIETPLLVVSTLRFIKVCSLSGPVQVRLTPPLSPFSRASVHQTIQPIGVFLNSIRFPLASELSFSEIQYCSSDAESALLWRSPFQIGILPRFQMFLLCETPALFDLFPSIFFSSPPIYTYIIVSVGL